MSSIYKKGRDGYYYYQAYTRDANTGKKNKRIFHSLGTKKLEDAKKMQLKYDKSYGEKSSGEKSFYGNKYVIYFSLFVFICFSFFFTFKLYDRKNYDNISSKNFETRIGFENKTSQHSLVPSHKVEAQIEKLILSESSIVIPEYHLQRIESMQSDFNQVKIIATIDDYQNSEDIKQLCIQLRNSYSEYSNYIICIYTNTEMGIALANSQNVDYSYADKKESWVAMYSYNDVEGEYFDDNPTSYLNPY